MAYGSKGDPIPSDYGTHRGPLLSSIRSMKHRQKRQPEWNLRYGEDALTRTGYPFLTLSDNFRIREKNVSFNMTSHGQQQELAITRVGEMNQRFQELNWPVRSPDPELRNQCFLEALSNSAVVGERNRLAREIHDTLVQEFAGILLHIEAANGSDQAVNLSECLARVKELAKCGLEDARRMLLGLRPKSLEGANLADALKQLAERFSRDCGIQCSFNVRGRPRSLAEEIDNELYRVAQEALCNVRKHSRAGCVSILVNYSAGAVTLVIKDNGRGFAMKQPQAGANGFGLPTMRDRASRLGGRMDIHTGQGTGTELTMSVPLRSKGKE